MKFCLICTVSVLSLMCTNMVADVVTMQPADAYSTVLSSAGWQTPQKTYTVSNTCPDYVYWQASSAAGEAQCEPQGGWIAPGAASNVNICPAEFMTAVAPGTYSDQVTLNFDPRVLGDINGDGAVNIGDLQRLVVCWGSSAGGVMYNLAGDLNSDGQINVGDLQLLVQHWSQTYSMTVL